MISMATEAIFTISKTLNSEIRDRLRLVGYGWLRVDIRPYRTFQQGVTNNTPCYVESVIWIIVLFSTIFRIDYGKHAVSREKPLSIQWKPPPNPTSLTTFSHAPAGVQTRAVVRDHMISMSTVKMFTLNTNTNKICRLLAVILFQIIIWFIKECITTNMFIFLRSGVPLT